MKGTFNQLLRKSLLEILSWKKFKGSKFKSSKFKSSKVQKFKVQSSKVQCSMFKVQSLVIDPLLNKVDRF